MQLLYLSYVESLNFATKMQAQCVAKYCFLREVDPKCNDTLGTSTQSLKITVGNRTFSMHNIAQMSI